MKKKFVGRFCNENKQIINQLLIYQWRQSILKLKNRDLFLFLTRTISETLMVRVCSIIRQPEYNAPNSSSLRTSPDSRFSTPPDAHIFAPPFYARVQTIL